MASRWLASCQPLEGDITQPNPIDPVIEGEKSYSHSTNFLYFLERDG